MKKLREFSGSLEPVIRADDDDKLEQLHAMLRKIPSLTDDDIAAGIRLTDQGMAKVQAKLDIDRREADLMIAKLRSRLHADDQIDESYHERFTYEAGFLNDVSILDSTTGKQVELTGSRGSRFLDAIKGGADPQQTMADYFAPLRESVRPEGEYLFHCPQTGRVLLVQYDRSDPRHGQWGMWSNRTVQRYRQTGYSNRLGSQPVGPDRVGRVGVEFDPHLGGNAQNFQWCKPGRWPAPLSDHFRRFLAGPGADLLDQPLDEEEQTAVQDNGFDDEIQSSVGSFNFPWRIGSQHGFACARYHGRGPDMSIVIASVVDSGGRILDAHSMSEDLEKIARKNVEDNKV